MSWLTQPWEHPFMQNAFLAAMLVGLICGVIGVFVVLRDSRSWATHFPMPFPGDRDRLPLGANT